MWLWELASIAILVIPIYFLKVLQLNNKETSSPVLKMNKIFKYRSLSKQLYEWPIKTWKVCNVTIHQENTNYKTPLPSTRKAKISLLTLLGCEATVWWDYKMIKLDICLPFVWTIWVGLKIGKYQIFRWPHPIIILVIPGDQIGSPGITRVGWTVWVKLMETQIWQQKVPA